MKLSETIRANGTLCWHCWGTHNPCFLFKHLFLQQLPDYVRAPLAASAHNELEHSLKKLIKFFCRVATIPQTSSNKTTLFGTIPARHLHPIHLTYAGIITDFVRLPRSVCHIVNTMTITIKIRPRETCNGTNGKSQFFWSTRATISGNRQYHWSPFSYGHWCTGFSNPLIMSRQAFWTI